MSAGSMFKINLILFNIMTLLYSYNFKSLLVFRFYCTISLTLCHFELKFPHYVINIPEFFFFLQICIVLGKILLFI